MTGFLACHRGHAITQFITQFVADYLILVFAPQCRSTAAEALDATLFPQLFEDVANHIDADAGAFVL